MKNSSLEQLARQKNLEQILDHLPEGIIGHDRTGGLLYFNRAAEAITGFSKAELLGRDCHEIFGVLFAANSAHSATSRPRPGPN